jgi:hypothetical protein
VDSLNLGAAGRGGWAERVPLDGEPIPLRLDIQELDQLDPPLLLRLAALLDRHQDSGCRLDVQMPRSVATRRQLALMQVDCDSELLGPPEATEVSDPPGFLPVVRFSVPEEVDSLAVGLQEMLNEHFAGALRPFAQPLFVALSELCENATTHGENPLGAFVAANRDSGGRCILAIGDLGVGIPAHIRRALPGAGDDGSAIDQAMRTGVSGAGSDRGGGYSGLFAAIEESKAPIARLRVWSAAGRMTATFRHGRLIHKEGRRVPHHTDGTWVSLELLPA